MMTPFAHEAPAAFADIQRSLYQSLESGPLTVSMLSQALMAYFPDKSIQELKSDCLRMLEGIDKGVDYCDRAECSQEGDIDQEIVNRLQSVLKDKTPQEQKQYLIQLFSIYYCKSGSEITPDLAVYIAGMELSELFEQVVYLIHQEGLIAGAHLIDAIENYDSPEQDHAEIIKAHADAFTPREHMWITSASMYAAGVQEDNPVTDPETIGRQVGFLGRFVQIVGKLCERYVAPALAGFACCAGCYLTVDLCISWMIAGEKALASLAFFGADSLLPALITSVVGSLGMSAAIILLLSGASLFFAHMVCNTLEDLDTFSNRITEKAGKHAIAITTVPETPAAQNGYNVQPDCQNTVSNHGAIHSV